jgi:hypothetical protein
MSRRGKLELYAIKTIKPTHVLLFSVLEQPWLPKINTESAEVQKSHVPKIAGQSIGLRNAKFVA